MATINVRFIGVFQEIAEKESATYPIQEHETLKDFFNKMQKNLIKNELKNKFKKIFEKENNFLILLNGSEINTLKGTDSKLNNGDEVVLIPISHGG